MSRERITNFINDVRTAAELVINAPLTGFTTPARREVGERDEWTCKGLNGNGCCMTHLNSGQPLAYQDGFMVVAAHYPERHHKSGKGYHDKDPNNGRILCTTEHAIEELIRGNEWGARKQLQMGVYHWDFVERSGLKQIHYSLSEIREYVEANPELFLEPQL